MMRKQEKNTVEKAEDAKEPFFGDCHLVELPVEEKKLKIVEQVILKQPVAAYYF